MRYEKGSFITIPNKHVLKGGDSVVQVVYMWICSFADERGICFPSRTTLAKNSGCSVRTVDRAIEMLCDAELLNKVQRRDGTKNLTNVYQIMITDSQDGAGAALGGAPDALGVVQELRTELNPLELKESVAEAPRTLERDEDFPTRSLKPKDGYEEDYKALIDWSVKRRGFKFASMPKQMAAIKKARLLDIGPSRLQKRWKELEEEVWRDGFDWASVLSSFDKRA